MCASLLNWGANPAVPSPLPHASPQLHPPQVVVAVDDSRSMAETGCGGFALEALTLICRAMARLEVGWGVAGGAGAV